MAHKWAMWLHNPYRLGVPSTSEQGAESEVTHKWASRLHNPTAAERGAELEVAQKWTMWLHNPCRLGVPSTSERGAESKVTHKWARWLHNPCRVGGPHRFRAGGRIRGDPQVGKVAT